jgi:hypothetical protein
MQDIKHVGRVKATGKKVLVAFRTLPGDAYNCLVIPTENLPDNYHDSLIQLVESPSGQSSFEFAEVLARAKFPDGSTMLPALHTQNRLVKIATDAIEMTPNFHARISLSDLNQIIADQRGLAVDDLSIKDMSAATANVEVQDVAKIQDMSTTAGKTTSGTVNEDVQPMVEMSPPSGDPESAAKFYRSQADKLAKQAADFRRKAEELVPTKKAK